MISSKLLLVDDHPLFLEGLQNLLAARNANVLGTAHNGKEALVKARQLLPDVVLMDIQMPICDGLEATRLIKAEMPDVTIVMLTMSGNEEDLFEAIKSGASGYLLKSLEPDSFFEFLEGLEHGEAAISRDLAAKVLNEFTNHHQQTSQERRAQPLKQDEIYRQSLTSRQKDVLRFAAQGMTNKEIGVELIITERTVKYHMREILQKLHLRNRAQVVAFAVSSGLVDPDSIVNYAEDTSLE